MNTPVYTSASTHPSSDRFGWAALDRRVLAAVTMRPGRTAHQIASTIPFRLVEMSLRVLKQQGLVEERRVGVPVEMRGLYLRVVERTVYVPTAVGGLVAAAGRAA